MIAILAGIGLAFLLLIVVCVAAVAMLGKSATSKFSSIGTAIDAGGPSRSIVVPTTRARPTTTTGAPVPTTWTPWTAPDGSFAIDFPGTPRVSTKNGSSPAGKTLVVDYTLASDTSAGTSYTISWQDVAGSGPTASLEYAIDRLAGRFNIRSRSDETYHGAPAVRVTGFFTNPTDEPGNIEDTEFGTAMYIVVGNRFYSLIAGGPKPVSYDFDHFLASFTGV